MFKIIISTLLLTFTAAAYDAPAVIPEDVYVPTGFDSNDRSQLVIGGFYPNSCYQMGPTSINIDEEKKTISIKDTAYYKAHNGFCLQFIIAYEKTIDFGRLEPGKYQVSFVDDYGKTKKQDSLFVDKAKQEETDDFFYAPVKAIQVSHKNDVTTVDLMGSYTNECMELVEIRVVRNKANVVELLPIMEFSQKPRFCDERKIPFKKSVELRGLKGKVLFHVRALNGNSINHVTTID